MEPALTTIVLDTHVLYWMSSDPERLSREARRTIERADELSVASISWYELAWLATNRTIRVSVPIRSWIEGLAEQVRTFPESPAIAMTAVSLVDPFPRDPTDRLIYATAIETGWRLVTKDERIRDYDRGRIAVW